MTRFPSTRRARRWSGWRRLRPAAVALLAAWVTAPVAMAQVGQTAMAPAGGVVNNAIGRLAGAGGSLPGVLYYGVNGADRGLGYRGSYMTLGGFIPVGEDDLGGFWSADLRGHLSTYGGFFSNVGAVRKQFIGGTLLGVGVYWDYDGDMNQYPDTPVATGPGGTYLFAGGQAYNQVGVSGEWLTDYGNIRSNGYIPVGSTAQLLGPYVGNAVLCNNGINAALGGADLEVGAYIPALADWAGMVSVGGYAFGNTRYSFPGGSTAVPWFGGVYTRLDMTFARNWDFSLQANDDSYFAWTGFARLSYRMGGSRRRNVPDQVEQPMMRNEHIVRAHQAPEVAINPANGLPWLVYHVDNTAAPGGNGTAETPYSTLGAAAARPANSPYDIVYVHTGDSVIAPYITPAGGFTFGAANQYLVGEGTTLKIPTLSCGPLSLLATNDSTVYPIVTNPLGPAIVMDQPGAVVDHLHISNSLIGISDGSGIVAPDSAFVSDVIISGNGGPFQRGVQIDNSTGTYNFTNVRLSNLTNDGFVVNAANGSVKISDSSLVDVGPTGVVAQGANAQVAIVSTTFSGSTMTTAVNASGAGAAVSLASSSVTGATGEAVVASGAASDITITSSTISATGGSALVASGAGATITGSNMRIVGTGTTNPTAPAILLAGDGSIVTIRSSTVSDVTGVGVYLRGANSVFTMNNASHIEKTTQQGILVEAPTAFAIVAGKSVLTQIGGNGIESRGGNVQVADSRLDTITGDAIHAEGVNDGLGAGNHCVWVQGAAIQNITGDGIVAINSNLRVERLDAANPASQATTIANTGAFGIRAVTDTAIPGDMRVLVDSASISGVLTGISAAANQGAGTPTMDFTASNNTITTAEGGTGISVSGVYSGPPAGPQALSFVNAAINGNSISVGANGSGILLDTVGGPAQLPNPGGGAPLPVPPGALPLVVQAGSAQALAGNNNNAAVVENPAPVAGQVLSSVNWNPAVIVPVPPPAPPLPP